MGPKECFKSLQFSGRSARNFTDSIKNSLYLDEIIILPPEDLQIVLFVSDIWLMVFFCDGRSTEENLRILVVGRQKPTLNTNQSTG